MATLQDVRREQARRMVAAEQERRAAGGQQAAPAGNTEVESSDGTVFEFPPGMSREDMKAAIDRHYAKQPQASPQSSGRSVTFQQVMRAAQNAHDQGQTEDAEKLVHMAQDMFGLDKSGQPRSSEQNQQAAVVHARPMPTGDPLMTPELWASMQQGTAQGLANHATDHHTASGMAAAAADGALLGGGDEFLAGLSAAGGLQPDGQGGANWFQYEQPFAKRYETALGAIRDEQAAFAQEQPGAAITGEVAGALLGPGKGAAAFIKGGTSTTARVGRGALTGGVASGAHGFGEGEGLENRMVSGAVNAPVGAVTGGALTAVGHGLSAAASKLARKPDAAEALPTIESLKSRAQDLYKAAESSGAVLPERAFKVMTKRVEHKLRNSGYDAGLHPRLRAVMDRLKSETGDRSLQEMEILRRVASNAGASLQPDERRLAGELIEQIDKAVSQLGGGAKVQIEARNVWRMTRKLEAVEEAVERAALQDNFAAGLKSQFKTLWRNKRAMRGFTQRERDAIRKVAVGTAPQRALEAVGKVLNLKAPSGLALTGAAAYGSSGLSAATLAGAGFGAKKLGEKLGRDNLEALRHTVTNTPIPQPPNALGAYTATAVPSPAADYLFKPME